MVLGQCHTRGHKYKVQSELTQQRHGIPAEQSLKSGAAQGWPEVEFRSPVDGNKPEVDNLHATDNGGWGVCPTATRGGLAKTQIKGGHTLGC